MAAPTDRSDISASQGTVPLAALAVAGALALRGICGQAGPPAGLEPQAPIVATLVADTDGDGRDELLLVERDGRVVRHVLTAERALAPRGSLRLRDPAHTLLAVADLAPAPGEEVVVADGSGSGLVQWAEDGAEATIRPLLRRARCELRLDRPQATGFVQDLNRDGRLDLLLPTLQGVHPFVQEEPAADGSPQFRALPKLPVDVQVEVGGRGPARAQELQGRFEVPQIDTADLDGDGRPDLLTEDGLRRAFHLQAEDGTFAAPIEVDLAQFVDSTPKAVVAPGSTVVIGDRQLLQRGDVDGDGIPDFVIAHRRKVWTFLASKAGPQFTKAHTQAVADDVTAMLVIDLDEDARADLLTFQVQVPSVGSMLLGLVQSFAIDVKAVGYRSEDGAFAGTPAWRRVLTLRVPPLLSLLGRQEELVKKFTDIVAKARLGVRGAFTAGGQRDLALLRADQVALELYPMQGEAPSLAGVRGRRLLVRLLFEDEDPVFDLDRVFALTSGLLDEFSGGLVKGREPVATAPLRDAKTWRLVELLVGEFDGTAPADLVASYERIDTGELPAAATPVCAFDLVVWRPAGK